MPHICIQGHRGAARHRPENSVEGVCYAFAAGAFAVEVDVQLSSDHIPVVVHDFELFSGDYGLPAGCERLRIDRTSFAALQNVTFGDSSAERFAHLERGFACKISALSALLTHPGVQPERMNLELKFDEDGESAYSRETFAGALIALLNEHQVMPWRIKSFDHALLERLQEQRPDLPLHALAPEDKDLLNWELPGVLVGENARARGVCMHYQQVTSEVIARFDREGLHVSVYTVNDLAEFDRLLALGVRDFISDDPELLLRHLNEAV